MNRKLVSMILAVVMLLCLSVPAFAEGEMEAPPPAEAIEETLMAGEALPVSDDITPTEDAVTEGTAIVEDVTSEVAPMEDAPIENVDADDGVMTVATVPVSEGGVAVNISGAVNGVMTVLYTNADGSPNYQADQTGIRYSYYEEGNCKWHEIQATNGLPAQLSVYPGGDVEFRLSLGYELTVENGTIKSDEFCGVQFRSVYITAPQSGSMTVNISSTDGVVPEIIPYTFYNNVPEYVVGGGSVDSGKEANSNYAYALNGSVTTGGTFEVWTAPGYAIEVLEGGYISETRTPSGAAAANVPVGSTSYVLKVDMGAKAFTIAAVKQGEHYQATDTTGPQTETPPEAETTTRPSGTFDDVEVGIWYADTVEKAYSSGIVKGVTENTFSPNSTTTRGQTVTMLYRAMGSPSAGAVFSDTSGEVAFAAGWASANGVTNGVSDTMFAPSNSITREQLVTMLYRMAGSPAVNTNILATYSDGSAVQSYAQNAVAWAITNGLLTGYGDGTIHPAGVATRAEVCALIMRYLGAA